ncbi:MAG TPA: class I SAM-dependent methyltransferase family protein [Candidatus Krumholzibacteriaceae bacterium]|nr:class I SAM-dependent methyltransferase family protein [Candidatus Krumholzibacteriaceae bacterium]
MPSSFDILGSRSGAVAIIEIPDELTLYEKEIAAAIQAVHRNVKSVLSKDSGRDGEYRLRSLRLISGDPDTEVIHKESGCSFKLDPQVTYFSTRESTERERIVDIVRPGEDVLVMFSGVSPIAVCIAKRHPGVTVTAIEINPEAHGYAVENVKLNKVADRVKPILGDVRDVCHSLNRVFDRVLMPLPKGAHMFLGVAISMVKPEGVLHFYHWAPEDDLYSEAQRLVVEAAAEAGRRAEFVGGVKVSLYSPRVYKVRVDMVVH